MRGIVCGIMLVLASTVYAQWEPEVLLHRQGDRLGWFYEKVEGLGDWTGDGIDDFAVLSYSLSTYGSAVDIWWGGETLSADPDTTIFPTDSCLKIENAGDLTGDGISEFVLACWRHELTVYRGGRGQAEVLQVLQIPQIDVNYIAAPGDISGDMIPDLVVGSGSSNGKVMIFLGNSTGFEGPVETLEGVGSLLGGGLVSGADMNGDGWGDFACTFNYHDTTFALFHPQPGSYLENYEIFKGNFAALIPQAYHAGRSALILAYRNVHQNQNTLYIHLGGVGLDTIPDAAFSLPELFAMSTPTYAADVNHDGWGDWVAGSASNFGNLGAFMLFLGGPWISNYYEWHGGFTGYWGEGKHLNGVGDVNGDGIDDFAMICADDTTGHHQYGQLVVFAGNDEWHLAADDRDISPLKSTVKIEAYPNPAKESVQIDVLNLSPGSAVVEVFNVLGQQVWRQEVQTSNGHLNTVWQMQDVQNQQVAAGIYFIQVIQRGVSFAMQKILVTG
ncbi:T9SS type A sorting domain-containing protein [bacterium]|nr:T9SS type A sorting domain-containing protein [bacterium]